VAAVGVRLVFWAPCGRLGGVAGLLGQVLPPWGVAGFLCPVWPM